MKKILILLIALLTACLLTGCIPDFDSGSVSPSDNAKKELTITEQVCFEHDGVKVTAKSVTEDSIFGTGIKFSVENDSDRDYTVSAEEVIVNNCMIPSLFSCEVAAGKKANDTLYLSTSALKEAGIKNIGQIEVYFYIFDSDSYETVYEAGCTVIKTSLYDRMETAVNDAGQELYNKGGIRIVCRSVDEDTFLGASVMLYIENNAKQNITVSCDSVSVNGYMVSSILSATVYKGKYALDDITLLSGSLEENGISSIDTIELKFHIFNPDTFETILDTNAIKFSPK